MTWNFKSPPLKSFPTETQSERRGKLFLILKGRTIEPDGLNIHEEIN